MCVVPKVLIFSITALGGYTVDINMLVSVLNETVTIVESEIISEQTYEYE